MSPIKKIYVWSVCLEPLLFFHFMGYIYAANLGLSRVFQIIVLLGLIIRFSIGYFEVRVPNIFNPIYKYYTYHMLFAVFSGMFGLIYGAYSIPWLHIEETMLISIYRPAIEHIIALYYFIYFVVLARHMLNSFAAIDYFFKVFSWLFYFSLIIGLFDLVLIHTISDYPGFGRHMRDFRHVGDRFHGLAGEPRDAFVYLVLGIGVLWLKDFWNSEKKLTKKILLIIFVAMLLTKSFSGLIGIVFSSILMFIFYFPKNRINKNILLILTVVLLNVIVLLVVKNTSRVVLYFDAFTTLYQALSNGDEVTSILKHTMNNIYPVWHRWTEVLNFNILPLFVGTGLGTSSVVNNVYLMKANVVINPQSNIVRMIFDVGIVGVFFLGYTFIAPIKRLFFQKEVRKKALILMLFILGAFFAHRSVAPFLFLGVLLATSKQLYVSMLMGRAVSMSSTET